MTFLQKPSMSTSNGHEKISTFLVVKTKGDKLVASIVEKSIPLNFSEAKEPRL